MMHQQDVAEEMVADSFIKPWHRRETFENADKVKVFFLATKNACLSHLNSAHARLSFDGESLDVLRSVDPDSYAQLVRAK